MWKELQKEYNKIFTNFIKHKSCYGSVPEQTIDDGGIHSDASFDTADSDDSFENEAGAPTAL
jgi:hypothetical protein